MKTLDCLHQFSSRLGFLLALTVSGVVLHAQTPTVLTDHATYLIQEDIQVTFAGGPGNPRDWIGIYPEGIVPSGNPPSTRWYYVGGTQTASIGLKEGTVTFDGGLASAGIWVAFLLQDDGYTVLAQTTFEVVDAGTTLVRTGKPIYAPGEAISVTFTNGLGYAKDWIGLYAEGAVPSSTSPALDWFYVDGTRNGTAALTDGTVTFPAGLPTPGNYAVHFFLDDSYEVLASEPFRVVEATGQVRILSLQPSDQTTNLPPVIEYMARITNGTASVRVDTIQLQVDAAPVTPAVTLEDALVTVSYTNANLYPALSSHTYHLTFLDTAASNHLSDITVQVGAYTNILLPTPLYFEDFDSTAEDSLPTGWTEKNYTETTNPECDLGNLDSASYARWTVVAADRFRGSFVTYSNPDDHTWDEDYHRVLSINPFVVKDGRIYGKPLADGRFAFANSGYRNGMSQVQYLFSPDFNLVGQTNIHLAFHSLWEQNQDSIAAVEYSIDQGNSWLPAAYYLETADVYYLTNEISGEVTVDVTATFTTEYTGGEAVARYYDDDGIEVGGTYGAFVAAPLTAALAPCVQPRLNDDSVGSKRIEVLRLPQADNRPAVRLRFAHAGTDSWYFGIDNVGLYAMPSGAVTAPTLTVARSGQQITISWPADATGFTLESAPSLPATSWSAVGGVTGNSLTVTTSEAAQFYRLRQ